MTVIFLPFAFAALTVGLFAQAAPSHLKEGYPPRPIESDWQREKLRGRVKVVQERWSFGSGTWQYNEHGFLYRSHVAGGSTQRLDSTVFEGNERRTYTTYSDYRTGYRFSELQSVPQSLVVVKWDSLGRLIETQYVDYETRHVRSAETHTYDESGRLVATHHRDLGAEPGPSLSATTYTESYTYGKGDKPRWIVRRDTLGLITKEMGFEYDVAGRVVRRGERTPPEPFVWLSLKYNKQGDLIEELTVYEGMKMSETYTYEYDDRGNWVKKTMKVVVPKRSQKKVAEPEVTYRQIVYFD